MATNGNGNSDEIDIGQVFGALERAAGNLVRFIGRVLGLLGTGLLYVLLFFQRYFWLLVGAVVVGFGLGYFLDQGREEVFVAKMVVEPNFNSSQQLYNNIDLYNDLAKAGESEALGRALGIGADSAATIRKIEIESYSDQNQKVKLFDEFIKQLDTTTLKSIEFENYLKNFNSFDARFHQVTVTSSQADVARYIQDTIVGAIRANPYFQLQLDTSEDKISFQDSIYRTQLAQIDSLQVLYKQVMLKVAENPLSGTSINLSEDSRNDTREIALLAEREVIKQRLIALKQQRADKKTIINVISDFPLRGVKQDGLFFELKYLMPIAMLALTLGVFALIELNKMLNRFGRRLKEAAPSE